MYMGYYSQLDMEFKKHRFDMLGPFPVQTFDLIVLFHGPL